MPRMLIAALLATIALAALPAAGAPRSVTLLHVNDTHSRLESWGPKDRALDGTLGGIARAATVIREQRALDPDALLVHGGDLFHGDIFFQAFFGVPELQILDQLGLAAMAIGNHEFEWGPDVLAGSLGAVFAGGNSPAISANLDLSAHAGLQQLIRPSMLRDAGGVKVGLFGLTTPYDPTEQPSPVVIREDLAETAAAQAAGLRAAGAEVVVMISHLGVDLDQMIVSAVDGVDLVVSAHDHRALTQAVPVVTPSGRTAWLVEAGSWYRWVGRVRLEIDGDAVRLADYQLLPVDSSVERDPEVAAEVAFLEQVLEARYGDLFHQPLAFAPRTLSNQFDPSTAFRDTAVGDLLTDVYRERGDTDVAVDAMGLMESELPAGWIVGADVFRTMSYGYDPASGLNFHLATAWILGADLMAGLEFGLSLPGGSTDFFLQVSGMSFSYDSCRPAGARILEETVRVGGQPFRPARQYSVTMTEEVLAALPNLGIPVSDARVLPEPEFVVARDELSEKRLILRPRPGRIVDVGFRGCGR